MSAERRLSGLGWLAVLGLFLTACASGGTPATTTLPPSITTSSTQLTEAEIAAQFGGAVYRVDSLGCGAKSVGTAFAVSEHHLVTNHHVIQGDGVPQLISRDGARYRGRVVGWSTDPDLAVIRVASPLLHHLEWASPGQLTEGERVVVLGYPQPNHGFTVTSGAIQSFVFKGSERITAEVDVAVDYGNSGSPALTLDGAVAGVVTAVDMNPGGLRSVPLVLPVDQARGVVEELMLGDEAIVAECLEESSSTVDIVQEHWADCPPTCEFAVPTLEGDTPSFPDAVPGYRNDGTVHTEQVRVFPGSGMSTPFYFEWAGHGCSILWLARWRVVSGPEVVGVVVPPYYPEPGTFGGYYWPDHGPGHLTWESLVESSHEHMSMTTAPPATAGGMLGGSICDLPAWFSGAENSPYLTDIVVDWIYWHPAP